MESYDAFGICIESCKLFSHLYEKLCGLIGEFGVELVEFLIRVFHCVVFLQSFQGAIKLKVITGHHNCGKDTPMYGELVAVLTHSGSESRFEMVIKDSIPFNRPNGQVRHIF